MNRNQLKLFRSSSLLLIGLLLFVALLSGLSLVAAQSRNNNNNASATTSSTQKTTAQAPPLQQPLEPPTGAGFVELSTVPLVDTAPSNSFTNTQQDTTPLALRPKPKPKPKVKKRKPRAVTNYVYKTNTLINTNVVFNTNTLTNTNVVYTTNVVSNTNTVVVANNPPAPSTSGGSGKAWRQMVSLINGNSLAAKIVLFIVLAVLLIQWAFNQRKKMADTRMFLELDRRISLVYERFTRTGSMVDAVDYIIALERLAHFALRNRIIYKHTSALYSHHMEVLQHATWPAAVRMAMRASGGLPNLERLYPKLIHRNLLPPGYEPVR